MNLVTMERSNPKKKGDKGYEGKITESKALV